MKKAETLLVMFMAASLALGLLSGCSSSEPASGGDAAGTTFVLGDTTFNAENEEPDVNPHNAYSGWACIRYGIGETLFRYSDSMEIEPWLATDYELVDERTWRITLRDGVTFSSGRALDGEAVKECLEHLIEVHDRARGDLMIDSISADGQTVTITTAEPRPTLLNYLSDPYGCIIDMEAGITEDGIVSGTGPYIATSLVTGEELNLVKNENYWDKDRIHLDRITYRFFDDTQSMANAYQAGEVDVATSLPSTVMELYDGQDDLLVTDLIATRYIYFNLNVEPLDDVRVREAINLAINREELCQIVGTDTEPTYNLIAKYMKDKETGEYFVDGAEQPFEENVERARELLAEAGYPNGEGFPTLTYSYPTLEMDSDTAQVIQEQLKENLNINIELNAQELQSNYSSRYAGDFDMIRMNWTADFADPYTYLSMLLSNSTYNCSGIQDAEYDALVEQSSSESDPAKRAELMHQAEQLAVGEQFYIMPLYAMKSVNLVNPKITGIRQIPASGALEYRYADIG